MGMIPHCEAGHNSVNFYLIQHKSYHKYILWGRQNLYIVILFNSCKTNCRRRVAQFGRALRSGRRGRKFESCHADLFMNVSEQLSTISFQDTRIACFFIWFFGESLSIKKQKNSTSVLACFKKGTGNRGYEYFFTCILHTNDFAFYISPLLYQL